jgi:dihydrofolate reductase
MRKLTLKMSMSVDGFVGGPNGEVDWIFNSTDEAVIAWLVETLWETGVHVMGSRTFHDMAAYWPYSADPLAAPMNEIPKIAFSRKDATGTATSGKTTTALNDASRVKPVDRLIDSPATSKVVESWNNSKVVNGDLGAEIALLKQQPGKDILAHGGASFARSLVELDLVDEYRFLVHPVTLGKGLSIFSALSAPRPLNLIGSRAFGSGAVANTYHRH